MTYTTYICINAWRWDTTGEATGDPSGRSQTYADGFDGDEQVDGWDVYLCHRDPETDDLVDPEKAPDLSVDVGDYAGAKLVADALHCKHGWEIREY